MATEKEIELAKQILEKLTAMEKKVEKIRQEHLEKEIKAKVERARAGLAMADRR